MTNFKRLFFIGTIVATALVALCITLMTRPLPVEDTIDRSFLVWVPPEETRAPEEIFRHRLFTALVACSGGHQHRIVRFWDHDSQPRELRGTEWFMDDSEVWYHTKAGGGDTGFPASWQDAVAPIGAKVEPRDLRGTSYRIRRVTHSEEKNADMNLWRVDADSKQSVSVFIGRGAFSK
jgi:hypothetical protein